MTKIKKTAERGMTANRGTAKPTAAGQTGSELKPTTFASKSKKAAAGTAKARDVASARTVAVNASMATEATRAMPKTTKQEQVLTMLSQAGGTTIDEIMKATGWQKHSVRGFFAGMVRKKLGFELTSEKEEGGERRYAIKVAA